MGVSIQPHLLKVCFTLSVIDACILVIALLATLKSDIAAGCIEHISSDLIVLTYACVVHALSMIYEWMDRWMDEPLTKEEN